MIFEIWYPSHQELNLTLSHREYCKVGEMDANDKLEALDFKPLNLRPIAVGDVIVCKNTDEYWIILPNRLKCVDISVLIGKYPFK